MTIPADPRLGTRLAGYQIQALLGRGGMGVVYRAELLGPHRPVALKLLLDPATASQAFRERFLRESELAATIEHPNVLPVYDAGETDGVLWIAMRYVDGTTPVRHSNSTHPSAYWSARPSTGRPSTCSGAT